MVQNAVDKGSKEMEICWVGLDPLNTDHASNLDANSEQTYKSEQVPSLSKDKFNSKPVAIF